MKNIFYLSTIKYLLINLLFLLPLFTNAQGIVCNSNQGITLTTQADIDNFVATYGDCNNVRNLTISGADITNVDSLYNIRFIGNTLSIQHLANLENLDGLGNLRSIFGNLVMENCPKITNLDAFANLGRLVFEVRINNMANLTSIDSLRNITPPSTPANAPPIKTIRIFNNPKLAACCALYDYLTHPSVATVAIYGNAGTCSQNSIIANPADATVNVVQDGDIIESGTICAGTPTQLQVSAGFTYQWADHPSLSATDIANPTIMPTENTTYSVTITGCNEQVATKTIDVTVLDYDRIYVKQDATGNNDGTSWENAFTELQPALNIPCTETEIWVAAGTYQPTEIPFDEHDGNERLKTFALSKDVAIYGGFAGTETTLEERNPATNVTILDGNGGYHTLIATALTRATVIDGFTIQGGNAGGGGATSTYAGADFTTFRGGGMLLNAASPTINNCIFKNNLANLGSAFAARFESSPLLTNCLLANNTKAATGSAPSVVEIQTNSTPRFINCTITNNDNGIAIRGASSVATYINTIIFANNNNFAFFSGTTNFRNSLVEGSGGSSNWIFNNSDTNDFGRNIDADPAFVDSDNGDYSLRNDSPAFNFGNNDDNETPTDLVGNDRIFNADNGGVIDLGAYELQELGIPEIAVEGSGMDIMHQDMTPSISDNTDFETNRTKTFTIKNVGSKVLTLGTDAVTITGAQAADFRVLTQPAVSILIGDLTTFTIEFEPSEIGIRHATISISNNDSDEQPFEFAIQGVGTAANAGDGITIDGPFCNGCDDPKGGNSLGCSSGVNQIIQAIDVSNVTKDFFVNSVDFNQETFSESPSVTVNIFCGEANTVLYTPANTPIYSQVYQTKKANNGKCVNIPFDTPPLIDADCGTTIWVEFKTTAGQRCVATPGNCNGVTATGNLTYIRAPGCNIDPVRTIRSAGFRLDASFALNLTIPFQIKGNLVYCAAEHTTTLSAGDDWTNYLWSNDATSSSIAVSAGTYGVTVTDADGATYTDEVTVTVDALSDGGMLQIDNLSSTAICSGSSTTITLSGHTGTIEKWQSSTDANFSNPTDISHTTDSYTTPNLTTTTYYRAVVKSGVCAVANSSTAMITVSPVSVGGNIAGGTTVSSGTNSTELTLSGHTGTIQKWQSSTDANFTNPTDINNTTTTLTATNLTVATYYRAVVKSEGCTAVNSATATISVDDASAGGSIAGSTTVCSGTNSTDLTLNGHVGTIQKWQSSTDANFTNPVDISNTTASYTAANLTDTTYYRAVVKNGVSAAANSGTAMISVNPVSVGGKVDGATTVCSGNNNTQLSLNGQTGAIINWQSSTTADFSNPTDIANTSNSFSAINLTDTTYYRVVVKSGVCSTAFSEVATVAVHPDPTTANAGLNQQNICGEMTMLSANSPTVGEGKWTVSPEGGQFGNIAQANTTFQGDYGVYYTLTWTITAACMSSSSEVVIHFNADSDNDSKQDCIDLCPGGDDLLNTDGEGLPDACDCDSTNPNDETVYLPGDIITKTDLDQGIYQSSLALFSTARINPNKVVIFKAGRQITLQPGFHAQAGSDFSAIIEYCNFPENNLVKEETESFRYVLQEALAAQATKANLKIMDQLLTVRTEISTHLATEIGLTVGPNPFKEQTTAFLDLPQATTTSLLVFDAKGQLMKMVLRNAHLSAGKHQFPISDLQFSSGIYYVHLRTLEGNLVVKLISVR